MQGWQWVNDVRVCLINEIANSMVFASPQDYSDPCSEVTDVAYNSHPNCYTQSGFCDVVLDSTDCSNLNGLWDTIEPVSQLFGSNYRRFLKQVGCWLNMIVLQSYKRCACVTVAS